MRRKMIVYTCDYCGKNEVVLRRSRFVDELNRCVFEPRAPEFWGKVGEMHLCDVCLEAYDRLREGARKRSGEGNRE